MKQVFSLCVALAIMLAPMSSIANNDRTTTEEHLTETGISWLMHLFKDTPENVHTHDTSNQDHQTVQNTEKEKSEEGIALEHSIGKNFSVSGGFVHDGAMEKNTPFIGMRLNF